MIRMRKSQNYKGVNYDIVVVVENENTDSEEIRLHIECKEIVPDVKPIPLISRDWIELVVNSETLRMNKRIDELFNPSSVEDICRNLGFDPEVMPYHE